MENKKFWTMDINGEQILRDLYTENINFTIDKYYNHEFDSNNYMYYENFSCNTYDSIGCDYERYGCYIKENDIVLDIGANIGVFAHRAECRGASRVICFEPLTPTFNCLFKNKGLKTEVYKMAIWSENTFNDFSITNDFTQLGGGSYSDNSLISDRNIVYKEKVFCLDINTLFESKLFNTVDFLKMDVEGAEVQILNTISDEHLSKLRCISAEFHSTGKEFDEFQSNFLNRCNSLGFKQFTLYYGSGFLRTVNLWKE